MNKIFFAVLLLGLPALGLAAPDGANDATSLPEPETLALLAGAAVAWAVVQWRKRK